MEEGWSSFKILVDKPTRNKSLGSPRRRWDDTIRMDLKEIGVNTRFWLIRLRIWFIEKPL